MIQFFGVNNLEDVPKLAYNQMLFMENIKSVAFGISAIAIVMDNDKYCTYTFKGIGASTSVLTATLCRISIDVDTVVTKGYIYNITDLSDYEGAFLEQSTTMPWWIIISSATQ